MAKTTAPGKSIFGLPVATEPGLTRILVEHGDGQWSICLVRQAIVQQFPDRPVEAQCTFSMDNAVEIACKAFASDPSIRDDPDSGRKLAAAVIMFSMALGILDSKEKAA